MARITIGLSVLLLLLGAGTYLATGQQSVTALIPAFFGLPLLGLGLAALNVAWRKHAMHAAAAIALLGFFGALARPVRKLLGGESLEMSAALASQVVMASVCAALVILAVKSFIDARRRRWEASISA